MPTTSLLPGGGGLQPAHSPNRLVVSPTKNKSNPLSDNSNNEDTDDDSKGMRHRRRRRRHQPMSPSRDGNGSIGSDQQTVMGMIMAWALSIRLFLRNPSHFVRARRRRSRGSSSGGGRGGSSSGRLLSCVLTTICLVVATFCVLSNQSKIDANAGGSGVGGRDKAGVEKGYHHHEQQRQQQQQQQYVRRENSSSNSYFPPRLIRYYIQTVKKENKKQTNNHRGGQQRPKPRPQLSSQTRVIGSIDPKTQMRRMSHDLEKYSASRKRDKPSLPEPWEDETCEAMVEWQKSSFPTCNQIHEVDLLNDLRVGPEPVPSEDVEEVNDDDDDQNNNKKKAANDRNNEEKKDVSDHHADEGEEEEEEKEDGKDTRTELFNLGPGFGFEFTIEDGIEYNYMANEIKSKVVNHGYFRDVWMIRDGDGITKRALKTLRYKQKVTGFNNDRHRRDAVAMERLTSNPYILDIYGYCGNSALFEYSEQGDINDAIYDSDPPPSRHDKLRIAAQVATGVAATHEVGWHGYAAMAHTDISPGQFMLIDGFYKLNDFNRVRFIRKNRKTQKPCTYTVGNNPGEFRSPEEYRYDGQTEKVDVYSMGNTFYVILMKKWPFELEGAESSKTKELVMDGERPQIHSKYIHSKDPAIRAIVHAIEMCFVHDPEERASAAEVRDYLIGEMDKLGLSLI